MNRIASVLATVLLSAFAYAQEDPPDRGIWMATTNTTCGTPNGGMMDVRKGDIVDCDQGYSPRGCCWRPLVDNGKGMWWGSLMWFDRFGFPHRRILPPLDISSIGVSLPRPVKRIRLIIGNEITSLPY